MKKKIVVMLSLVLCLLLSISLAACSKNKHEAKLEWKFDTAQHWHECATKGHDDKLDVADHTWNDGKITTDPTETAEGVKTFICTVCKTTKTAPVEKLTHTHTYATEWSKDAANHWYAATCEHTEEVKDKAAHTWNGGAVTTEPTYTADGVKTFTCTVCGATKTESEPKLSPKDNAITVGTIDFTYNAKSQPIDSLITADNKAEMVIKYVGVDGTEYAESTTAPTNAGTYQYTITIPATAEWKAAEASGKFTIAKYELTVLYEKTHTTKEYDGNAMILVEYKSLDGTDVNIVIFMKFKDAGTEIDRIQLPGLLKDNYTYDQSKVKAEILPKKLSDLKLTIQESDIDKEQVVVKFTMEIDGVNKEKVSVILEFYWEDLDNEEELQLTPDLPEKLGTGKCKITLKDAANYELNGNIGTLTLVR